MAFCKIREIYVAKYIQTAAVSIAAKKSLKLFGIMECGKAWEEPDAAMIMQRQKAFFMNLSQNNF